MGTMQSMDTVQQNEYITTAQIQLKSLLCLSRVCKGEQRVTGQGDLVPLLYRPR